MNAVGIDIKKHVIDLAFYADRWRLRRVKVAHHDAMCAAFEEARQFGCRVAVIEKPHLGRRTYDDAKTGERKTAVFAATTIDLSIVHGMAVVYATMHDLKPWSVLASEWQPAMLTVSGHFKRQREALKERSVYVARVLGAEIKNDDQADAVCIAEFGRLHWRTMGKAS